MAGERAFPGIGLSGFYTDGSAGWGDGVSADLRLVSALTQCRVISRDTSLPGSPTDGDIYIIPSGDTDGNDIALRDNGAWVNVTPEAGFAAYVEDEDTSVEFDGTDWVLVNGPQYVTEATAARTLTNADFNGRKIIKCTSGSATTISINTGLSPKGPLYIMQDGAGLVTLAGSATINSLGAIKTSRGQYTMLAILPLGSDVYHAEGVSTA